ncbi:MAG: permease [Candidatus Marinimicrobia bacterium]|nr:permease [Candidatus Neomarinimicrobiota bacterium]MCF7922077.1 permease [Candidatus Neomarinimicrobiota bacterium]
MTLLVLAIGSLLLGPLLAKVFEQQPGINRFLDGFILVSIGGIAVIHLLPEAVVDIGFMAVVMVVIGALLPYFAERAFHNYEKATHSGVLVLAFSGILVHTLMDGIAVSQSSLEHGSGQVLAYAVILHRLPVGLLIWWALKPLSTLKVIFSVLALMSLATAAGFQLGAVDFPGAHSAYLTYFQALVTGSLLHVLFHRHIHKAGSDEHEHEHAHPKNALPSALGALAGAGLLFALPLGHELPNAHSIGSTAHLAISLFLQSAPALLLGFVIASSIQNFIPDAGINWLHSKSRSIRVGKGMLFGLPLPICSCGVVPLYHSLIRRGVSVGAGMAFLIATPELGIDAIMISVPLLGWKMTVVRLIAAALIAWLTGYIMDLLVPPKQEMTIPMIETEKLQTRHNPWKRFWLTLNHEMIDHLGPWVLMGLIIAAITDPFLSKIDWSSFPYGVDILIMAVIGMPLYVCATGATPIAAVMLLNGVSGGAVLAFLITGPATNITTLGVMKKLHGGRVAIIFPLVIIGLTIVIGIAVNIIMGNAAHLGTGAKINDEQSWINLLSGGILLLLFAGSLFRIGPRGMLENLYEGLGESEEEAEAEACDCGHDEC